MITIPAGARILLATRPIDFRKGAHGLAALAQEVLGEDPFRARSLSSAADAFRHIGPLRGPVAPSAATG